MNIKLTEKQKIKILNSDDVFEIMQKILLRENRIDREKEHFWVIGLAMNNKILFIELVCMGSVRASTVEPMNVYRVAVLKGAVNIIFVHNHPSGELTPSDNDKDLTDRLIQVGKILAIDVIDHLIIKEKSYLSFGDTGLLEKLMKSTKWMPSYELEMKIREEEEKFRKEAVKAVKEKEKKLREKAVRAAEEKGREEEKIEIVKMSIKEGLSVDLISKLTGLPIEAIEKL